MTLLGLGAALPLLLAGAPWFAWELRAAWLAGLVGAGVWFHRARERELRQETEYCRRLESQVRQRTRDLADRNAELQLANAKLHEASHTDALTGLRNRRYLFEQISGDIDQVQRQHDGGSRGGGLDRNNDIVFMMVDLDHFKPVNDAHGHVAGDRMLLEVRDVLLGACRSSDVVIRWGGDEFLVIGREATGTEVSSLAERIRAHVESHVFELGSGVVAHTTCSVGFASYPFLGTRPDLVSWEQVLGIADMAMYLAKEERNAWVGIHGEHWQGTAESLLQGLQEEMQALAAADHVGLERPGREPARKLA